jgi:glutamate-1-semialdehyde 2,1-aminomutase
MITKNKSIEAFRAAQLSIPGGVNSPVRAFSSVGGHPLFIQGANGAKVTDIDSNEYIDYVGSWGPMILGHRHPDVIRALSNILETGTSFGAPTLIETEIAELIKSMVPSIEMVRMVNSGTEATMSALRLARGYTGRNLVIKFEGCYHGHGDSFLIKAGSGALTLGSPNSPGVTSGTAKDTLLASYNDLNSVSDLFKEYENDIAAVILEPITGNMGVIVPDQEFIEGIRSLCTEHGALLIFDEVMTGFRVAKGGAQQLLNITPDITTFGKIIGGGLPVGAYGGKKEIMEKLAPLGPVYQAGTLSGNPMAMAAGLATLKILNSDPKFYDNLEVKSKKLEEGLKNNLKQLSFPGVVNRVGSMFTLFFTEKEEVKSFSDVMSCNTDTFSKYFNLSIESGIYLAPSQYEAGFVSAAHTDKDINTTIEASYDALRKIKN